MTRLLLDQGIPYSTTFCLQNADWEAVHVSDIGMSRATDRAILDYARNEGYLCITLDADFHTLLAIDNADSPSVIRIRREGLNGEALANLLHIILPDIKIDLDRGAMVTVTERTLRVRHLPIIKSDDSE